MASIAITGSNRGIGLELVKRYRARGDAVVAICRSASRELEQTGAQIVSGIDVADPAAVRQLAYRDIAALDVLINVAGVLDTESFESPDWPDSLRYQFEVNALGPLAVTRALQPCLGPGAKVAILTSRMGSIADNGSGGYYGYRMSKAAVNMAGVNLARELEPRGVAVYLLHPGYVRTAMTAGQGSKDAARSAAELTGLIDRLTLADTGTFWHAEGYELAW